MSGRFPQGSARDPSGADACRPTTARYAVTGPAPPRLTDALMFGELARRAAMGMAGSLFGRDAVPPVLSGHGADRDPAHPHAFFLPEDADRDGWIDHLVIHARAGFDGPAQRALAALDRLYAAAEGEWALRLEALGPAALLMPASALLGRAAEWVSVTPYLRPWHARAGFGAAEQIGRECRGRGLPEPAVALVDALEVGRCGDDGAVLRPEDFRRQRDRAGLRRPDRGGAFCRLRFPEPIPGPLALGYGCHFGLGLFEPAA